MSISSRLSCYRKEKTDNWKHQETEIRIQCELIRLRSRSISYGFHLCHFKYFCKSVDSSHNQQKTRTFIPVYILPGDTRIHMQTIQKFSRAFTGWLVYPVCSYAHCGITNNSQCRLKSHQYLQLIRQPPFISSVQLSHSIRLLLQDGRITCLLLLCNKNFVHNNVTPHRAIDDINS